MKRTYYPRPDSKSLGRSKSLAQKPKIISAEDAQANVAKRSQVAAQQAAHYIERIMEGIENQMSKGYRTFTIEEMSELDVMLIVRDKLEQLNYCVVFTSGYLKVDWGKTYSQFLADLDRPPLDLRSTDKVLKIAYEEGEYYSRREPTLMYGVIEKWIASNPMQVNKNYAQIAAHMLASEAGVVSLRLANPEAETSFGPIGKTVRFLRKHLSQNDLAKVKLEWLGLDIYNIDYKKGVEMPTKSINLTVDNNVNSTADQLQSGSLSANYLNLPEAPLTRDEIGYMAERFKIAEDMIRSTGVDGAAPLIRGKDALMIARVGAYLSHPLMKYEAVLSQLQWFISRNEAQVYGIYKDLYCTGLNIPSRDTLDGVMGTDSSETDSSETF